MKTYSVAMIPALASLFALAGCVSTKTYLAGSGSDGSSGPSSSDRGEVRGNYSRLTLAIFPSERTLSGMRSRPSNFSGGIFYQPEIWYTNMQTSLANYFKGVVKVRSLEDARTVGADLIAVVDCAGNITAMTNRLTLELGASFTTPDGAPIASIFATNRSKGSIFYANNAAYAEEAQNNFNKELLYSRKLSAFAQNYRRPAAVPVAAVSRAEPAGVPASDIDRPAYHLASRPNDYALVVGVGKYSALPEAQYAERDVEAVREHLVALGLPQRNIIQLSGSKATRGALQGYLEEWLPKNVKADSTVFFYYSGHGAPDAKTGQAFLVPWDGNAAFLQSTAYPLKQLYGSLGKLRAKSVIVALDSCFSGAGGRSVLAQGARPLVTQVEEGAGSQDRVTVFAAASTDEITGTLAEQGHGAFTYYFLKGLGGEAKNGAGLVTAKSLFDYLSPNVQDEAHRQNREQTPKFIGAKPDQILADFK